MKRGHVLLLLALGAAIAFLLWKGPAAVEQLVLRALGQSERARRAQLIPSAQLALDGLREELEQIGIETFIGSTLRTPEQQKALFDADKSPTSTVNSWHILGRAVDLYPIGDDGQPDLAGKTWDTLFRSMHEMAPRWGFRGLAFNADGSRRYIKTKTGAVWDGGHLEFPEGMTFSEAKAASVWGKKAA